MAEQQMNPTTEEADMSLNIQEWFWQCTGKWQKLIFTFMLDLSEDYSWCSTWLKAGGSIYLTLREFHALQQGYIGKHNLKPELQS
jgi:hypothetical protein